MYHAPRSIQVTTSSVGMKGYSLKEILFEDPVSNPQWLRYYCWDFALNAHSFWLPCIQKCPFSLSGTQHNEKKEDEEEEGKKNN